MNAMNCQQVKQVLTAYIDGEFSAAQSLDFERHLAGCPNCSRMSEEERAMALAVAKLAPRFEAPPELRDMVLNSLRDEREKAAVLEFPPRQKWTTWAVAALAVIGAFVAGTVISQRGAGQRDTLSNELVASHVRSMMADHIADIISTDQHTVKPWFDGKLDFAPPVADFMAEGFPLAGGRLDYLMNRSVAALVYRRDKHIINLFVWPSIEHEDRAAGFKNSAHYGYHIIRWTDAGMSYAAVSDLNEPELHQFAQLVRAPRRK